MKVLKDKKTYKEEINLHKPKLKWKEKKEWKDIKLECKVKAINSTLGHRWRMKEIKIDVPSWEGVSQSRCEHFI